MQGYMFAHMNSWSRKGGQNSVRKNGQTAWTVEEIIDEIAREQGASSHVKNPNRNPMIYVGTCKSIGELRDAHAEACKVTKQVDYTNPKNGKKSKRMKSLRKDAHTLFTVVASLPIESADALADPKLMGECLIILNEAVKHQTALLENAGGEFALAVLHTDEKYIHVHILGLDGQRGSVNRLHPGKAAVDEIRRNNGWKSVKSKETNRAYCDAMRGWQNDFHQNVFGKFGLLRYGPKRMRLSRADYNKLKAAQEDYVNLQEKTKLVKNEIDDGYADLDLTRKELEQRAVANSDREAKVRKMENQAQLRKQKADALLFLAKGRKAAAATAASAIMHNAQKEAKSIKENSTIEARQTLAEAEIAANAITHNAQKEAKSIKENSTIEARQTLVEAETAANAITHNAQKEAETIKENSTIEARQTLVEAETAANAIMHNAQKEAKSIKENATSEARQTRVEAEKMVSNAKETTARADASVAAASGLLEDFLEFEETNTGNEFTIAGGADVNKASSFLACVKLAPDAAIQTAKKIKGALNTLKRKRQSFLEEKREFDNHKTAFEKGIAMVDGDELRYSPARSDKPQDSLVFSDPKFKTEIEEDKLRTQLSPAWGAITKYARRLWNCDVASMERQLAEDTSIIKVEVSGRINMEKEPDEMLSLDFNVSINGDEFLSASTKRVIDSIASKIAKRIGDVAVKKGRTLLRDEFSRLKTYHDSLQRAYGGVKNNDLASKIGFSKSLLQESLKGCPDPISAMRERRQKLKKNDDMER